MRPSWTETRTDGSLGKPEGEVRSAPSSRDSLLETIASLIQGLVPFGVQTRRARPGGS
jgi:hypothetical protein